MGVALLVPFFFFFFQAEDGIRDRDVTGVQTCALPIWKVQVVSEFRRAEDLHDSTPTEPDAHDELRLDGYRIDASITKGLGFSAAATIRLTPRRPGLRWARFKRLAALQVGTVRDDTGGAGPLTFYRTKKSSALWVRLEPPSRTGETRSLRVVYHGDLIGFTSVMQDIAQWWPGRVRARLPRVLDRWYYVKSSYDWLPRYGGRATDVDLPSHPPHHYRLA